MSGAEPTRIGRYDIEGVLGRGAMGVIYRAHDPVIDRKVAIKLIRADLLDGDDKPAFIARFQREAQAAGRCAHPNIVAVYDFALHEGNPFLAMEFVDGVTLAQVIAERRARGERMPVANAVAVMQQVLAALEAAHGLGIVHRDIKPANIMLTEDTRVKVADFGISRLANSSLTQEGATIGTPSYMSPEQCRGEAVDARSDVFSAGVVLFEMLSGEKPFAGGSAIEVMGKLLSAEAPALTEVAPHVPRSVSAVVRRSLVKDLAGRFASAGAMAGALRAAMAAPDGDLTIVGAARLPMVEAGQRPQFDRDAMEALERTLATYVGPIAKHLVASAARSSDDLAGLCASLASSITSPADRDQFAKDAMRRIGGGQTSVGTAALVAGLGVSDKEADAVTQALTRHLGPVARVLVKRARAGVGTMDALRAAVAAHIDDAAERAVFLRGG